MQPGTIYPLIFLVFNLTFLAGVAAGCFWLNLTDWFWWAGLFLILILVWLWRKALVLVMLAIFCGFWAGNWLMENELNKLSGFYEGPFQGQVRVVKEPEFRDDYQRVVVEPVSKEVATASPIKDRALIFAPLHPGYQYGDRLEVSCRLGKPKSEHAKFNYQRFLAKDSIYQICQRAKLKKLAAEDEEEAYPKNWKQKFFGGLFGVRRVLEEKINRTLPQPESAYLAGLLLGGEGRLPDLVATSFRLTGTTHVVAVSGSNVAIIAGFLLWAAIGLGLWRRQAMWLALGGISLFILMIGAPSSAVRAGIMGGLLLWAANQGRWGDSARAVVLTAVLMTLASPFTLVYDVGFQLSVAATLGIIYFYPWFKEKWKIEKDFLELKSILAVTVAAQIGVSGILIYNFEALSIVSLPTNLIILPPIPLIMGLGAVMILFSFLSVPFLTPLIGSVTYLLLKLEITTVEFFARFPWASQSFEEPSLWWPVVYYLFWGLMAWKISNRKPEV